MLWFEGLNVGWGSLLNELLFVFFIYVLKVGLSLLFSLCFGFYGKIMFFSFLGYYCLIFLFLILIVYF